MSEAIKAVALSVTQLKMLDIGAPVIVSCQTLSGETVAVRLQTRILSDAIPGSARGDEPITAAASWVTHGAYVAVMPAGVDYGS